MPLGNAKERVRHGPMLVLVLIRLQFSRFSALFNSLIPRLTLSNFSNMSASEPHETVTPAVPAGAAPEAEAPVTTESEAPIATQVLAPDETVRGLPPEAIWTDNYVVR
jgi:hypothetical protein